MNMFFQVKLLICKCVTYPKVCVNEVGGARGKGNMGPTNQSPVLQVSLPRRVLIRCVHEGS